MSESRAHETVQQDQLGAHYHQYHNPGDCPGSDDGDLHRFGKAVTGLAKDDLQRTAEENAAHISKFYDDKTRLCVALSEEDIIIRLRESDS
jgi:hypothetical protein